MPVHPLFRDCNGPDLTVYLQQMAEEQQPGDPFQGVRGDEIRRNVFGGCREPFDPERGQVQQDRAEGGNPYLPMDRVGRYFLAWHMIMTRSDPSTSEGMGDPYGGGSSIAVFFG